MRPRSWVDAARGASVSHQDKPFSHRGWAVTTMEKDVARDMKERERERRALLSCAAWPVSFDILVLDMVCL